MPCHCMGAEVLSCVRVWPGVCHRDGPQTSLMVGPDEEHECPANKVVVADPTIPV